MRCFVAITLDEPVRRALVKLLAELRPRSRDVRWSSDHQLHVTLKFLGEVDPEDIQAISSVVTAAAAEVEPFDIRLTRLGVFPNERECRVLWCGVADEAEGTRRWVELADPFFEDLGIRPEGRRFTPHITLGRMKGPAGKAEIRKLLQTAAVPAAPAMGVSEVTLFESELRPESAVHTPLLAAPLGR